MTDYKELPGTPDIIDAITMLGHVIDSLGFRYYWATEGLTDDDLSFSPAEGAMTLGRQMAHVLRLVQWTDIAMRNSDERVKEEERAYTDMRQDTLAAIDTLKQTVTSGGVEGLQAVEAFGLPFWNLVNGPVTDCFTHVGQINSYRRILGKPSPQINYFSGKVS